jgi:hypothetical protein
MPPGVCGADRAYHRERDQDVQKAMHPLIRIAADGHRSERTDADADRDPRQQRAPGVLIR